MSKIRQHMKGFADGASCRPINPELSSDELYMAGWRAGREAFRAESRRVEDVYGERQAVIKPMGLPGDKCKCGYSRSLHELIAQTGGRDEYFGLCRTFTPASIAEIEGRISEPSQFH